MTISTSVHKWTARTKHAVWAFLFLTSYGISMIAPFVPVSTVSALETGWKTPTATHSPDGWDVNAVANVQADDDVYATENDDGEQGYSGFDFGLPAGAVINGIEIRARALSTDNNRCHLAVRLSWDGGSSTTSSQSNNLTNNEQELTYGGATDTWGHAWTVAELNNSSFVSIIKDDDPGSSCNDGATTSVDTLSAKVYYTVPVTQAPNPELSQACGLDIALVIDNSNSISYTGDNDNSNGTTDELGTMKSALKLFVDALAGTPTQFSVTKFGSTATVLQQFSDNTTTIKTAIDNVNGGGGGTNWEDGLLKAYSTFDPRTDKPDLVIFASDGNPTYHIGGGSGSSTSQADIDAAISQANVIKNAQIRMLALGIGNDLSVANLKAISGNTVGTDVSADVITADFTTLSTKLGEFAAKTCGGTITVQKKIINSDGTQIDAANWQFNIAGGLNPVIATTDQDGLTPAVKVSAGSGYSVTETQQAGYTLKSASCTTSGQANGVPNIANNGVTGITVTNDKTVSCTFVNQRDTAKVVLIKHVDNTYGGSLGVNSFGLSIGDTSVASGQELVVPAGVPVTIDEAGATGYEFVEIYGDDGCPDVLGGTVTPAKDQTITCTIKNASKPATLIVNKIVNNDNGGTKKFADFKYVINGGDSVAFEADGSNSNTLAAGTYNVIEVADDAYDTTYNNCTDIVLANGATATCTITNTAKPASLTLKKEVINGYGTNNSPSDFTPTISGQGTSTNVSWGKTITLKAGNYTASESNLPGFEASGWTGDCATDGVILLSSGDNKTCTITNAAKPSSITGKKIIGNTDFSWVTAGTNPAAGWTIFLDSDQDGVHDADEASTVTDADGNYSFTGLSASMSYYVKEIIPTLSGWEQITGVENPVIISTVGGSSTGNDFTNKAYGSITVVKQLDPESDNGRFNLLVGGQMKVADVGDEGKTQKLKVDAGTYSIAEEAGTGTNLNGYTSKWACTTGLRGADGDGTTTAVTVKPGEDWTCTFTNTRKTGTIKVIKDVTNDNGGTKTAANDFTFTNNGSTYTFNKTNNPDGERILTLPLGSQFKIEEVEANQAGYITTYSGTCSGVVKTSQQTCTIKNNDRPPKLTLKKEVINNNGGTRTKYDWILKASGPTTISRAGGVVSDSNFKAGIYTLSEIGPNDYAASDWDCGHTRVYHGRIDIDLGDTVTCTITNNDKAPELTLIKKVVNKYGSNGRPSDWLLTAYGPASFSGHGVANSPNYNFKAGTYFLAESGPSGYSASDWDCGHERVHYGKINISLGERVVCTITNTRDTGSLTIVKDAQPNSSQSFRFTIAPVRAIADGGAGVEETVPEAITGRSHGGGGGHENGSSALLFDLMDSGDGTNSETTSLPTGKYHVSEAEVGGWDLTDITCTGAKIVKDGQRGFYVEVTNRAQIVCTFTNTQRAQLTIVKDARPNATRSFGFTSTIPDSLGADTSFSLTDDGSGLANSKKFENLKPGIYTITETAADAWKLDDIACTGIGVTMSRSGYVLTVKLAAGAVANCTFVNSFIPQVLGETDPGKGAELFNTGAETIVAAAIALGLSMTAVVVSLQRKKAYMAVRKD